MYVSYKLAYFEYILKNSNQIFLKQLFKVYKTVNVI